MKHPFFNRVCSVTLAMFVVVALVAGVSTTYAQSSIAEQLDALLNSSTGQSAIWGVYIHDIENDEPLYSYNADKALTPASNQKVFTTAAALDILGADHRYHTYLYFDGEVDGSVLRGDLIIRGSGDPTFGSSHFRGNNPLRTWARELADMGVTRIEGRVVGDDTVFPYAPYADGWDIAHVIRESFAPPSGGLVYGDNVIRVHLQATQPGQPPRVRGEPDGYFEIDNRATTSSRGAGRFASINRRVGQETVTITGSVTRNYRGSVRLPVADPTSYTLYNMHVALERAGVQVDGPLVNVAELPEPPSYDTLEPLLVHRSPPMSEIVNLINKESNNLYAEQVYRSLGWDGSLEGATRRVRTMLTQAGINSRGMTMLDGSGLSRKALVTPEALGRLLAHMHSHEHADVFRESLARPGEHRSTLQYRLAGTDVRAKTGSLQGVRTLSGYTTAADGRPLAFVVFANNFAIPAHRIRNLTDSMVMSLTTSSFAEAQ